MLIRKILIGVLSFYYSEVICSRSVNHDSAPQAVECFWEKKKQKERKKSRPYENRKWKKKKAFREKTFSLKGTRSKDHRYSNQQRLRRMYRNS